MNRMKLLALLALLGTFCSCRSSNPSIDSSTPIGAQGPGRAPASVPVVRVVSQKLDITVRLPGELHPYEVVAVYPKVTGFVKWIGVDRGSHVRDGELIACLEAPELVSQRLEAQAKLQSAQAQLVAVQARLASDEGTYQRLKTASTTPGVVAGNDLAVAEKNAEADRAQAKAAQENVNAAQQALLSVAEMEAYLQVKAPFDGIVTERNVHPGALVGSAGALGVTVPMVRIEMLSRLRLVVPIPENYVAGIPEGTKVDFTVPSYVNQIFSGTVARISHALDPATRTMPVELDVKNPTGRLAPGMFAEVQWPVRRPWPTLFVPISAVARTTERAFVVRVRDGKTEWVDVKTGAVSEKLIEVFGELKENDEVALRATDELRPDTSVSPQLARPK
jgi:membrane fusion protein (multidrug efflux system)